MLDPIDLGNIGYQKVPNPKKPTLPHQGTSVAEIAEPLFQRNNFSPNWVFSKGVITQGEHKLKRWQTFEPIFYPPPFNFEAYKPEFPNPEVLQKGETVFRPPLIMSTTTLEDMIAEATKKDPKEDPINTLMMHFNIRRQDITAKYMKQPFRKFLRENVLPNGETNGRCIFDSYQHGFNTGDRFLVPKAWFAMSKHPLFGPR
jgi:hypothetical protein